MSEIVLGIWGFIITCLVIWNWIEIHNMKKLK